MFAFLLRSAFTIYLALLSVCLVTFIPKVYTANVILNDFHLDLHILHYNALMASPTGSVHSRVSTSSHTSVGSNYEERPKEIQLVLIKVITPSFHKKNEKTFHFALNETVWKAKQKVLVEFSNLDIKDALNFGFYLPPQAGRAGKFLDESRYLQDYPMDKADAQLEFRYKRRIFRHLHPQDEKKLLKINTKKHRKRFMEMITTKSLVEMERILEKGLDPNFQDEKSGETPLIVAAMMDNCMQMLKILMQYGAYLDFRAQNGKTAVHAVAIIGKIESLRALLDLGASPNYRDDKGLTPLYYSIVTGSSPSIAELLLNERAEIGVLDLHGSEEVHQACKNGHSQHLEHLIYYGANINARSASGSTPLHICALENQETCTRVLLFRGADRDIRNYAQQTPYEVAIVANNFEIAALIIEFKESDVKRFVDKPKFSKRRLKNSFEKKVPVNSTIEESPSNSKSNSPVVTLTRTASNPDMHKVGLIRNGICMSTLSLPDILDELSGSESDSDNENELKSTMQRRCFSNAGIGTQRSPAPIKAKPTADIVLKKRLYAGVPGRLYLAINDYEPLQGGELSLQKGDIVEVLYVGEQGFWEGKVDSRAGWFPSYCVQEMKKKNGTMKSRSWFSSKRSPLDIIDKAVKEEAPSEREVILKRNDKGFGFQMRGANSHVQHIEFTPTPQFPALQYIGDVDKGGVAEKAGLTAGDFVLEINGENVVSATHSYAVSLINKGGKVLSIKVISVAPEAVNPDLILPNGSLRRTSDSERYDSKLPPPPPTRSLSTTLTHLGADEVDKSVPVETVVIESNSNDRKTSVKGMWSGSAYKLHGDDVKLREENISVGMGRKQKAVSCDYAAEFNQKFKQITKQVNVDTNLYPAVKPKPPRPVSMVVGSSPKTSPSNDAKEKLSRQITPPGYEYTMDSLRRGRASSIGKGDNVRPHSMAGYERTNTVARKTSRSPGAFTSSSNYVNSEVLRLSTDQKYATVDHRRTSVEHNRQRLHDVPQQTVLQAHQNMLYRTDYGILHEYPQSDRLARQSKDVHTDGLVRLQSQRQQNAQRRISPATSMLSPPPAPTMPPPPPPPPPPPVQTNTSSSSTEFGNSIANAVAARTLRSKSNESEGENTDRTSSGLGFYNSSSSVSLDSAGSKDSGFENMNETDHSSLLSQAIAARAARLSREANPLHTPLPSTKEVPEIEKSVVEEIDLVKPSEVLRKARNSAKDLNVNEVDNGYSSPPSNKKHFLSPPPTTKPKPSRTKDGNNNRVKGKLSEDLATFYLDGVIADAEASIDYDLISITSANSNVSDEKDMEKKTLEKISTEEDEDFLPPPPLEMLQFDKMTVEVPDVKDDSADGSNPTSPVGIPASLSNKPHCDWSTSDVADWLSHLNLHQYCETFIENDIEGKHLIDLSKDELKELGVTKLGHRKTLSDAIKKLFKT